MLTDQELQALLDAVNAPYVVEHVDDDAVSLPLKGANAHISPGGTVSGPALMALADGTAWATLLCRIGTNLAAGSTSLHVDFLRPPEPADVVGEGSILRSGKSPSVIEDRCDPPEAGTLWPKPKVTCAIPKRTEGGSSAIST